MKDIKPENFTSIYNELADLVGVEVTLTIYKHYKGLQIVFPTRLLSREYVKQQMIIEYSEGNLDLKKMARTYLYSERWLRKILSDIIEESENSEFSDS